MKNGFYFFQHLICINFINYRKNAILNFHSYFIAGENLNELSVKIIFYNSDFIWPFLRPYMGVIPNPKMAFIFPISCILALIFPILIKYFPKCVGKGSFPKSEIKSLYNIKLNVNIFKSLPNDSKHIV